MYTIGWTACGGLLGAGLALARRQNPMYYGVALATNYFAFTGTFFSLREVLRAATDSTDPKFSSAIAGAVAGGISGAMAGPGQGAMSAVFWGASAMAGQALVDAVDGASVDARRAAAYQQAVERRAMLRGAAVEAASRGVDPQAALQGRGAAQLLLGPGVAAGSAAAKLVDGTAAARAVEAALDPRERWVVEN